MNKFSEKNCPWLAKMSYIDINSLGHTIRGEQAIMWKAERILCAMNNSVENQFSFKLKVSFGMESVWIRSI